MVKSLIEFQPVLKAPKESLPNQSLFGEIIMSTQKYTSEHINTLMIDRISPTLTCEVPY